MRRSTDFGGASGIGAPSSAVSTAQWPRRRWRTWSRAWRAPTPGPTFWTPAARSWSVGHALWRALTIRGRRVRVKSAKAPLPRPSIVNTRTLRTVAKPLPRRQRGTREDGNLARGHGSGGASVHRPTHSLSQDRALRVARQVGSELRASAEIGDEIPLRLGGAAKDGRTRPGERRGRQERTWTTSGPSPQLIYVSAMSPTAKTKAKGAATESKAAACMGFRRDVKACSPRWPSVSPSARSRVVVPFGMSHVALAPPTTETLTHDSRYVTGPVSVL